MLITGTSGRIGSAIARRLANDAEIIGIDRRPGAFTSHVSDIGDRRLVRSAFTGVDAVVHVGALHAPDLSTASDADFQRVNVDATQLLLEESSRARVPRFVFTSTTSVYGCTTAARGQAMWVTDDLPPNPEDVYDATKLAAEALCRAAATPRFTTVILRMSRCFPESPHLVAFYRMFRGVDERDVADAHAAAIATPIAGSMTMNISGPTPFERDDTEALWRDPWSVIERRAPGVRTAFANRGWPLPPRIDRVYVSEGARRVLGYEPRYGVMDVVLPRRQ